MTQNEALDILKLGSNVYLTGPAGSGKTYVLNQYLSYLKEKDVEVGITASTGIAATHIGGQTIHSWAGIGIKKNISDMELEAFEEKEYLYKRINKTKVLVIDEISMLDDARLDLVDRVCRLLKRSEEPFGGIQVILSGDFFQLPPISKPGEAEAQFVNHSDVWSAMNIKACYLEEQFRQVKGDHALQVLEDIRKNNVTDDTLEHLRGRYKRAPKIRTREDGERVIPTQLYTHNVDVEQINQRELEKLEGEARTYEMASVGKGALSESLKKSCMAPEQLVLKKNARVMFVKNNFEEGYVNGTLGTVIDFNTAGAPVVEIEADAKYGKKKKVTVEKTSWSIDEDGKTKAEIAQLPLRLAWAITVHKSQGMSLDAMEVDLSKSFTPGMGYVALSRVRTLDGLKLHGLNEVAMQVAPEILELDEVLRENSQQATKELSELSQKEKEKSQEEFLHTISPTEKERRAKAQKREREKDAQTSTYDKTKKLVEEQKTLEEMAKARSMTTATILSHLEKLLENEEAPDISYLKPAKPRFSKIKKAFESADDTKLTPVKRELDDTFTFEELRLARLFL